ncbi:MAG: hypothetical protein U0I22_09780 [Treponema sp.]|nr:hypothetical protein [Treponema sp.]
MKKRFLFPALLFIFIAIIFTIGCTNHMLKSHQSDPSILVQLEKSNGARNATTGDYQITAWIENRDGTKSHHQEINSTAGADASIIFEELAIGSEINIHLEVVETGTTGKKLVGTSDWITVNEGTNVVVIVLREDSDTGEIDDPVAGDDPEDEGDLVLTSFEVQYDSNQYQLVNTNIDLSKITITEYYNNADTGTSVKASEVSNDYIISFADGVDTSNAIGYLPAYVEYKHDSTIEKQQFIIPIKYQLDANNLTISGNSSVEQNEELKLTAEYKVDGNDSYNLYTSASSSGSYKIIENVNISWQGATKQPNSWEALAETSNAGTGKTATVTLTPKDEWCVTTGGITASHTYTVTAITQTYNIGDEYRDDSGALKGYVFEVNDSYIKIVETNEGWQYYWCGTSTNINNWSNLINISDGEEMYNAVKNQSTGDNSIFTYANNKNTSGESGWYIPTKEELFDIFKMNETHDVLNISGAYWSSSLESITGGYTAYYVQGTGESDSDLGTNYIDEDSNSVVAVKKIEL